MKMKLDTGAATNVMPLETFTKITPIPQIKPPNTVLRAYGGQRVTHIGTTRVFSEWPQQAMRVLHSQIGITTDLRTLNV